jgi:acyl CoA:acetate/3-ketoacid CoA transferase alpha subunit
MDVLQAGIGEFSVEDPDTLRAFMRTEKRREMVEKLMPEADAVRRYVNDGDYVSFDFSSFTRGPASVVREIIRQRKRNLWFAAKFTLMESTLLAAGGCLRGIDVGFLGLGALIGKAVEEGRVKVTEWTNGTLALRHLAGAMGVPFLPTRSLLATDTLTYSGAKVVHDPFTRKPIALVPAVNPDVGLVHAHQCDIYGNARCFGPGVSPLETAMASKRTIISTEEIITTDDIRKEPSRTTIPYYLVDAVVYAPFGCLPGGAQGMYEMDTDHFLEYLASSGDERRMGGYLEKYVYSVASHDEFLEKRVGVSRLMEFKRQATITEGYH